MLRDDTYVTENDMKMTGSRVAAVWLGSKARWQGPGGPSTMHASGECQAGDQWTCESTHGERRDSLHLTLRLFSGVRLMDVLLI